MTIVKLNISCLKSRRKKRKFSDVCEKLFSVQKYQCQTLHNVLNRFVCDDIKGLILSYLPFNQIVQFLLHDSSFTKEFLSKCIVKSLSITFDNIYRYFNCCKLNPFTLRFVWEKLMSHLYIKNYHHVQNRMGCVQVDFCGVNEWVEWNVPSLYSIMMYWEKIYSNISQKYKLEYLKFINNFLKLDPDVALKPSIQNFQTVSKSTTQNSTIGLPNLKTTLQLLEFPKQIDPT